MTSFHEIFRLSALEQAQAIRKKEFSCTELTRHYLDRIEHLNPKLHAFVSLFPKRALRQAQRIDQALARSSEAHYPTFYGVPTGIKDTELVSFARTQFGSRVFRYLWTPFQSECVRRIRKGGFVLMGKLATSEFAIMPLTETDIHPPCHNPWDLEHSPGGSSGGSAASVAAGLLPIANAADGGGSIRIPAAFCHLFGFKPSRDLMPNFYKSVDRFGLSTVNAISRDVDDMAAMLDVMTLTHYHPSRPTPQSFLAQTQQTPQSLRIRFCTEAPLGTTEPVIAEAVKETAQLLTKLGHNVEIGQLPDISIEEFLPVWYRLSANLPIYNDALLQPPLQWLRQQGRKYTKKATYQLAQTLAQRVHDWFQGTDIWLLPTSPVSPPKLGSVQGLGGEEAFFQAAQLGAFTAIFNLGGQPAASLPAGLHPKSQLPFGIQLVAPQGQDARVLALSKQLEAAMPWKERTSPLYRPL